MPRIQGYFEYDDGLTPGRSKDGGIHHNLYDHGRLKGHGKFVPSDEVDSPADTPVYINEEVDSRPRSTQPTELEKLLGEMAYKLVAMAAKKAEPHVKQLWNEQVRPSVNSAWTWATGIRRARNQATTSEPSTAVEPTPASPSQEVVAGDKVNRVMLTRTEARDLLVAALRARHFSEKTLEFLRNARIADGDRNLELTNALENLSPQQIEDAIQLMLEMNPSPLNDNTMTELRKILVRIRAHGWRGLSGNDEVSEILHPRNGER